MGGVRARHLLSTRESIAVAAISTVIVIAMGVSSLWLMRSQEIAKLQGMAESTRAQLSSSLAGAGSTLLTLAALRGYSDSDAGPQSAEPVVAEVLSSHPYFSTGFFAEKVSATEMPVLVISPVESEKRSTVGFNLYGDPSLASLVDRAIAEGNLAYGITSLLSGGRPVLTLAKSVPTRGADHTGDKIGLVLINLDLSNLNLATTAPVSKFSADLRLDTADRTIQNVVSLVEGDGKTTTRWPVLTFRYGESLGAPFDSLKVTIDAPLTLSTVQWGNVILSMSLAIIVCAIAAGLWRQRRLVDYERRHAARKLSRQREMAETTLRSIGDAVVAADKEGRVVYLNASAERMLSITMDRVRSWHLSEVLNLSRGRSNKAVIPPMGCPLDFRSDVPMTLDDDQGRATPVDATGSVVRNQNGETEGFVVVLRDVTRERKMTQRLAYEASHDRLTGLRNRLAFERKLTTVLESLQGVDHRYVVCYLDLDDFKQVNDTCGHIAGDSVLAQVGTLLRSQVRESDFLARLGGDEFGILLRDCGLTEAREMAERIRAAMLAAEFKWQERRFRIGISIGVLPLDTRFNSLAEVMQAADAACYTAKSSGRNHIHVYDSSRESGDVRMLESQWSHIIHDATREGRFVLYRQKVNSLRNKDAGPMYEILLALKTENDATIKPRHLFASARRFGLGSRIDRYVIEQVMKATSEANESPDISYSINLTAQSLSEGGFIDFVVEHGSRYGIDPGRICFEIGERELLNHLSSIEAPLAGLRSQGYRLAIDDFGSGWESVGFLKNLPVDMVKIAGHLVQDMHRDPVSRAMVATIIDIARVFDIVSVGKNVETSEEFSLLNELGADLAQGYFLGRPTVFAASEGYVESLSSA